MKLNFLTFNLNYLFILFGVKLKMLVKDYDIWVAISDIVTIIKLFLCFLS